jgi:hypothetical protein
MIFKEQLENINACEEALNWVKDKTLQEAFTTCERADWMLWAYAKLYPDNLRELTLAKGHCANTVRHLMKDDRSIAAIDAAINYGNGIITLDELNAAATSAYATAYIAGTSAYAAAYTDADATTAIYAAAATAATAAAARKQSLKEQADICRKYLTL